MVSVLMPVYNCEMYVGEAINSILNQTFSDFEFIIIDDASTDGTIDIIKGFKDSRIQLIEKPKNSGYTNSLNHGISIAKGKYIARMDADDISKPERFMQQINFLEANADIVVCGTHYSFIDSVKQRELPLLHEDIKNKLLFGPCIGHPTVMLRTQTLKDHNIVYRIDREPAEDYHLWVKLLEYGKLHNLVEILLEYRIHDGQVSNKRINQQKLSVVKTKIEFLEHIGYVLKKDENKTINSFLLKQMTLCYDGLVHYFKIKQQLLVSNTNSKYFKSQSLEKFFHEEERDYFKRYFLNRKNFKFEIYKSYLMVTRETSSFKLDRVDAIKLLIKSLLFFKRRDH